MGKTGSLFKKIATLSKTGLEPVAEGRKNYEDNILEVEAKALSRSKTCGGCELFIDEPISFLKVEDERIRGLSGKMCNGCGCSSAYLLRQDLKECKKW